MNSSKQNSTEPTRKTKSGIGGLIAILVGIIFGALVGVFYGHSMWVASGGLEKKLLRLEETLVQKETFTANALSEAEEAANAGDQELAQRLRDRAVELTNQRPVIRQEIEKLTNQVALHQQRLGGMNQPLDASYVRSNTIAIFSWEIVSFMGDLFLQVLKLLVIPLVMTSMICGITSLGDVRKIGRVGGATIFYYMTTGGIAVLIGIVLVQIIQPGAVADDTFAFVSENVTAKEGTTVLHTLLGVFRGYEGDAGSGMFPSNIFHAAVNTNVLALIVFAIVFGGALTTIGKKGQVAIDFFTGANEAVMKMVHMVMFFAPAGIFGLVAGNIAKHGGGEEFGAEVSRISWYVATVLIGLALHVVVLGLLLTMLGKRNPFVYTSGILRALLTAMSTASSSATLPITMECVEKNNQVSKRSASFVLPLGATVNMDGTALYEAVAAIFIAQSLGIELSFGALLVIFLTATLAAVGAAGIPEAGLVTMVIVLTAVGLPLEGIGTILAIDWFLDRMRTTVNVYGDAIGAGIIDRMVMVKT